MSDTQTIESLVKQPYKYGFKTNVEYDYFPKGLNEDIVNMISDIKEDPDFMREFRLKAYRHWTTMRDPLWANIKYPRINYDKIQFYSAPKKKPRLDSLDEVDPEILET